MCKLFSSILFLLLSLTSLAQEVVLTDLDEALKDYLNKHKDKEAKEIKDLKDIQMEIDQMTIDQLKEMSDRIKIPLKDILERNTTNEWG